MVRRKETESDNKYPLISLEEMVAREQKYIQRLNDINASASMIEEAKANYLKLYEEHKKEYYWQRYLTCDGLPKPHSPHDIKNFIDKCKYYDEVDTDACVNWTLSINEHSTLSQDIFRKDLTRSSLITQMRPDIGGRCGEQLRNYLLTLELIDALLDSEQELCDLEIIRVKEIIEMHTLIEKEIQESFNRLIYRVITADSTYMSTVDGIQNNFGYENDDFKIHIWSLRTVPIRFQHLLYPLMIANMVTTNVKIQLPLSVLSDNLTLSCIHGKFDHFSSKVKCSTQIITKRTDHIISGMPDMMDSATHEWLFQLEVQDEIRNKMLQKYAAYEEIMKQINSKATQSRDKKNHTGKNLDKKVKLPRPPAEPQNVPEDMYPDTYNLFLVREEEQNTHFMNEFFHPDTLNLAPGEINLRQYILLDGNYSIYFIHRPKYTDFQTFNLTTHEQKHRLYILKDIVANLSCVDDDSSSEDFVGSQSFVMRQKQSTTKSFSRSRLELNKHPGELLDNPSVAYMKLDDNDVPYIFVTFKLPRELCLWGAPVVCQFIETEVTPEEAKLIDFPMDLMPNANIADRFGSSSKKSYTRYDGTVVDISQRFINEEARNSSIANRTLIKPRTTETPSVFRSTLSDLLRNSLLPPLQISAPYYRNYQLDKKLTKPQIRALERFCLPRIISSFKFPMEMKEKYMQEFVNNSKQLQKPLFVKASLEDEEPEVQIKFRYNFEDQAAPERVFPIFPVQERLPFEKHSHRESSEEEDDENTFYGVLSKFEKIEKCYIENYKKIDDQNIIYGKVSKKHNILNVEHELKKKSIKPHARPVSSITRRTITEDRQSLTSIVSSTKSISDHNDENENNDGLLYSDNNLIQQKEPKQYIKSWSTKYIYDTVLNKEEYCVTVKTDRLGIFGFAYKRYAHFPFLNWSLKPTDDRHDEMVFTLDTQHVRAVIFISGKGFRGYVTDLTNKFVANPVKYLSIEEPIESLKTFKKKFIERNFNIFPEQDASFYIENGYFSQKHLAMENHVYNTMAIQCTIMQFFHSGWNRLSTRRDIILCMRNNKDAGDETVTLTVHITPENATFVEVRELCSENLDVFRLEYTPTWRNIAHYSDFHHLIISMQPQAYENRNRDPMLLNSLKNFLAEVRPLSFA